MSQSGKPVVAQTRQGRLEGSFEKGQFVFRGIPYAAPPTGRLRWRAPVPAEPWTGVRSAKAFGPVSPQNPLPGSDVMAALAAAEPQDEDCLYLNVWTPGLDDAARPVMVWIHGGAFIIGSGSEKMYRDNTLVPRGDVVLVTLNYRLGAFGFMNLREITGGRIPATGCEGLLDQVAALDWVRDNIAAFGGDPANVTVFGESAGAMSIGDLMGMPAARGRFGKAILESGGANTVGTLEDGVAAATEFLGILGLAKPGPDALLALPAERILDAQQQLALIMRRRDNRLTPFQPVVDGEAMPDIPLEAIKRGSAAGIRTLAGTNRDEFKLFNFMDPAFRRMDEGLMLSRLRDLIPEAHIDGVVEAYRGGRQGRGEAAGPADILTAIQSDFMFRIPVLRLLEAQGLHGRPAYNYLFSWESPAVKGALGSCHALEIGFVFGNCDPSFCGSGPDVEALSRKIQDAWTSFARTGDPSCDSLGGWAPYAPSRATMVLDRECRMTAAAREEERRAWDAFELPLTKPI
ncbi:MAG: carboxylesterase/lipase family protein [Acidobacteria bacterium]|nr:carboxylesterase/lipase family protein [Acidobacteriota bacterium]